MLQAAAVARAAALSEDPAPSQQLLPPSRPDPTPSNLALSSTTSSKKAYLCQGKFQLFQLTQNSASWLHLDASSPPLAGHIERGGNSGVRRETNFESFYK